AALEQVQRASCGRRVLHTVSAVDLGGDRLDLLPQPGLDRVEVQELARLLRSLSHRLGQLDRPGAAVSKVRGQCAPRSGLSGDGPDGLVLAGVVTAERVDGNHW